MRTKTLISATALVAGLVAGGLYLSPSFARDGQAAAGQPWLSITQIADRLDSAGYRNIEKIEREHGGYEVRATDRDGNRVKLHLNPWTGELAQADGARRGAAEAKRSGVACSERRCRDDMPLAGTAKSPAQSERTAP